MPAAALGLPLAEELERLGPFGQGSPRPTLLVPAARMRDVRGLGSEDEHAALTLSSGGARARVVAFGSTPGSLRACVERPHEVAARLELNEWNGVVEPRLLLRALRESEAGECEVIGEEESLWEAIERELGPRLSLAAEAAARPRALYDRRGEGFAGTVGDLVSRGERVLVVCADVPRRRPAIEEVVGGLGRSLRGARREGEPLAVVAWGALERDPGLARPFPHVVALDPPNDPHGERLLVTGSGPDARAQGTTAHACWGRPEVDFARRAAHAHLDLRPPLASAYRALREQGERVAAEALERALRGEGSHPRDASTCARLLRVLVELELLSYTPRAEGGPACRLALTRRTELDRSATYRDSLARLDGARRYLDQLALRPRLEPLPEAPAALDEADEQPAAAGADVARAAA